jgi:hypothetical protein
MGEKTFNGQDWATHTVSLLLENTCELYDVARSLAMEDSSGDSLREWVTGWFWDNDMEALGHNVAGAVRGTRDDMSKNEFDQIDWKDIAASLAAE